MHIVYFQGGFGNQLFQYCFYMYLVKNYGYNNVYADISHYIDNKNHGGFHLRRLFKLNYIKKKPDNLIEIYEKDYSVDIVDNLSKNYIYIGYWQNPIYILDNDEKIINVLNVKKLNYFARRYLDLICNTNSVSIHVRRGDYINHYLHGNIANKAYYLNSIKLITEKIGDPVFFVFSDDLEWCRQNIYNDNYVFYYVETNKTGVETDLILMSKCKHNIISNSTYSWWAQRLNRRSDKMVICPEYWFNKIVKNVTLDSMKFFHVKNYLDFEKKNTPFFSIIITTYNREISIKRCLASALAQAFENIEIIVVDDGSTDGTYNVIKEYAYHDHRIKIVKKEKNESLLSGRIAGMKEAIGSYILFLDSDDYLDGDACKTLYEELKKNNVDLIEFSYKCVPEGTIVQNDISLEKVSLISILQRKYPHTVWNKAYSSKLIKLALINSEEFYCNMSEDVYFSAIFFNYAAYKRRIKKVLYYYVVGEGISTSKNMNIGQLTKLIESIKAKGLHLRRFVNEKQHDLLAFVDEGENKDINWLVNVCLCSDESIFDKIKFLQLIDSSFEVNYFDGFEKQITSMFNEKNTFEVMRRKKKIIFYVKQLFNVFLKQ